MSIRIESEIDGDDGAPLTALYSLLADRISFGFDFNQLSRRFRTKPARVTGSIAVALALPGVANYMAAAT
jgi:hypothetical protein